KRRTIAISTLAAALAIAAAFFTPSCGGGCTVKGCPPVALILADLSAPWNELANASATVCRNSQCLSGKFVRLGDDAPAESYGLGWKGPEVPPIDAGTSSTGLSNPAVPQGQSVSVSIFPSRPSGPPYVDVTWSGGDARPGDRYRVMVMDAAGAPLLSLDD